MTRQQRMEAKRAFDRAKHHPEINSGEVRVPGAAAYTCTIIITSNPAHVCAHMHASGRGAD